MTDWSVSDLQVLKEELLKPEAAISRKEIEKEQRINDILEAAEQAFAEKNFHEVTVDEIAMRVGVSKGSIYLYFKNKEELFFSVLINKTRALVAALTDVVQSNEQFEDCLTEYVRTYIKFFQNNVHYFMLMQSEKTRNSLDAHYQMHEFAENLIHEFLGIIETVIEKGVEQKVLRKAPAISMAKMLAGMLNMFTFSKLILKEEISVEEEVEQVVNLFLNGVRKK
jgi:TetR/AcrR family transcriptional regulator